MPLDDRKKLVFSQLKNGDGVGIDIRHDQVGQLNVEVEEHEDVPDVGPFKSMKKNSRSI